MHHRLTPLIALAVVLGGALAGCGIDEDVVAREAAEAGSDTTTTAPPAPDDDEPAGPAGPGGPATPFTVEDVPAGYELLVSGPGEATPDEGHRAVTVLAPDGEPVGRDVVFVEAAPSGSDDGFVPARDDRPWSVQIEDGVRVWGLDAAADDLLAIATAAEPPTSPGEPPTVPDPPRDLEVAGRITADGVMALAAGPPATADGPVPGPASARVSVWMCSDDCAGSLVVMTVPAGTLDPAVVVTEARWPRRTVDEERDAVAEEVDVAGAPGVVTTTARADTGAVVRRELAVEMPWGDVLVLIARGTDLLDADQLVAVAASVAPD